MRGQKLDRIAEVQSLSLIAEQVSCWLGCFNAANIKAGLLDISFTYDLMCPLWSGRPGMKGVQTCDPVESPQVLTLKPLSMMEVLSWTCKVCSVVSSASLRQSVLLKWNGDPSDWSWLMSNSSR